MRLFIVILVLICVAIQAIVTADGAQVRVQNFTGTNIVLTNAERRLTVPPGEFAFNLEAGEWGAETFPTLEVAAVEETIVARYSQDEALGGVLDLGGEMNLVEIALRGYVLGWVMFGFAWMVSAVREGLKIGLSKAD